MTTRLTAVASLANELGRMAVGFAGDVASLRPSRQKYFEDHF
ncbi:MAG: hypothetical protein U0R28_03350 [Candidatus Nanopelagicales bacterium]